MKRVTLGIFVLIVITLPVSTNLIPPSFIEQLLVVEESTVVSYTPHAPIYIYDDDDFVSQGWPGGGTPGSPYRISGFNFTNDVDCIVIEDTTAHFVIEDCYIGAGINDGITLDNVTNGVIRDTFIGQKTYAVFIDDSTDCQVTNVTFIRSGYKVYLRYSVNIHVDHCTFEDVSGQGIWMEQDTGSVIEHNNLSYQEILIWDSADTDISHNVIYHNEIQIQNCDGLTLLNNSIDDVFALGGAFNSDSVLVTVLEQEPTTTTPPTTTPEPTETTTTGPTTPTSTIPEEGLDPTIFVLVGGLGAVLLLLIVVLLKKKQAE